MILDKHETGWQNIIIRIPLDTNKVRGLLVTDRYYQGLRNENAFHIDAFQLCRTLSESILKSGIAFFENSPMKSFSKTSEGWLVQLEYGNVSTRQLIFCCGGYGGSEFGRLRRSFLPITTYVVVTPHMGRKLAESIRTTDAVTDERRTGNYYPIVDGDRPLWGEDITVF